LEFAVSALQVRDIVVLGHAFCGGIKAFASDDAPLSSSDFIGRWMSQIAPAADAITAPKQDWESYLRQLEFASVELSLRNLMTFPFVKAAVDKGELSLHGAYFGVASGRMLVRNEKTGAFEPVAG
jgi:carbonic anhydrase